MRHFLSIAFLFLLSVGALAQLPDKFELETSLLRLKESDIPNELTSTRSLVIYDGNSDWKKKCGEYHDVFQRMGVDPVLYIRSEDLYANGPINKSFRELFASRDIENCIIVEDELNFSLLISKIKPNGSFDFESGSWYASGPTFQEAAFTLALQLRGADLARSNFLVLTEPEFLEDINLFRGRKYNNYPGAVRRQKVALALFEKYPKQAFDERASELVSYYNEEIDKANEQLVQAFAPFEWEWQPLEYKSNDETLKEGIQYVVQVIGSSGNTVKNMLNYPKGKNETHFISVTPSPLEGEARLKKIESDNFMYKVYIHQVRADDMFVGEEWDADLTWEKAFDNFFFTMQRQFE